MTLRSRIVVVLLAVGAACAARADGQATIAVRADPPTLALGTDARAVIEIEGATERPPAVTTNAGRVENVRPLGGGRFAVDYLVPPAAHPQVAIIAAVAGGRCGWTSIPLIGRGVAVARAAPLSRIRVTIGTAVFGPVFADSTGEAQVPVVVPPGVRFAYQRGKPLDLKIPETPHVHLALGVAEAAADAAHEVAIWAFAVTAEGAPRSGAPIQVAVTAGEVGPLTEVAPGTFAGTWRLPPGRAADATATASLADEPHPFATASIARRSGAPARLTLDSGRARVVAGEGAPVPLHVTATDAAGNPVDAELQLATSLGAISAPVAASPGTWDAELAIPSEVGAARRAEVVARAAGLEDRISVEVSPGPVDATRIDLVAPERRIAVAPKLGVAASLAGLRSAYAGAEGAYRPSFLAGQLRLALEVGTFVHDRTDEVTAADASFTVHGRARYVTVVASARWQETFGAGYAAWASTGGGLSHLASDVSIAGHTTSSESAVVATVQGSIAFGRKLGHGTPFAEARLGWHADPRLEALRGALTAFTLCIGYLYDAY